VAAAALEQSMLESKDKDTLLEMAKALGVKANARLKKADIIDKILDSTGSSSTTSAAPPASPQNGSTASAPAPASAKSTPTPGATPTVELGPDGEPLADWEIALRNQGGDTDGSDDAHSDRDTGPSEPADRAGTSDGDRDRTDRAERTDRNERRDRTGESPARERDGGNRGRSEQQGNARQGGGQQGSGQQGSGQQSDQQGNARQGGGQQGGGQQGGGQQGGAQQGGGQQGGGQQGGGARTDNRTADPAGDSNRRRRRRRKGRGGQEGPQGEDVELIEAEEPQSTEPIDVEGYLDIRDEGYGFLRVKGYLPSKEDAYIPLKLARQYGLRKGDHLTGKVRPAGRNEKNPGLLEVYTVNGGDAERAKNRPRFEDLTALFPDSRLTLEDPNDPANMTARIIDLVSPIGKGQRGIIVSPPKAGKTTIMKTIAKSIELNNPEVVLMVLLIDERPEEVTDMRRTVAGEVIASTFDRPSDEHTHVAEMAIAKARRLVEEGKDVVIMLDGITRLSRAYNLAAPASGRILSGGIDAGALYPPKKFFGSARNVEEGGSLTILATALVDTNSRMDEAIFEEFKGTGNMELRLDRRIAERRIYPAIDVDASSTRHEELLFDRKQLQQVWKLRRVLSGLAADGSAAAGLELLIDRLKTFRTNNEFLAEIAKQPSM
jgi:transcription termination factor Rho